MLVYSIEQKLNQHNYNKLGDFLKCVRVSDKEQFVCR